MGDKSLLVLQICVLNLLGDGAMQDPGLKNFPKVYDPFLSEIYLYTYTELDVLYLHLLLS